MREKVRTALDATWFTTGGNFDRDRLGSALWDADRAWVAKNKKWVRSGDFVSAYIHLVMNAIREVHGYPFAEATSKRQLRDILGPKRLKPLEDEIVNFTESLPRKYVVEIPIRLVSPGVVYEGSSDPSFLSS